MDKTKIFEAAGKLASKGQLDKAAKEYQRVLETDPKDVRALQKLAEIYQKVGKQKEATDLMLRVAEGYTEQGFFLKAVAVYKQILKLGQERIDVNLRLAQLYQQLGLVGDATQQYQLVANHYDKSGNVKESLSALRKMVDLDPDNVASRVKLGELYARERMTGEAVQELKRAAQYLKKNARTDDHLRVLERIGQLVPDDAQVAKELAQAFLSRNDTKRALAKLQVCFRQNPKDVETLQLLAKAFSDLGQEAKTVSVYRELARVYQESGQKDARRQLLERILQLAPGDPEATEALREMASGAGPAVIAPPAPAPAPAPSAPAPQASAPTPAPVAPKPLAAPSSPAGGLSPSITKILTETDVYLKYGLVQKAAEHVAKALAEDPASFAANEKLLAILDKQGRADDAVNLVARLVELARAKGDADRDSAYTQELAQRAPGHPLVAAAAAAADLQATDDEELVIEPDELETAAAALATEAAGEDLFEVSTEPTSPTAQQRLAAEVRAREAERLSAPVPATPAPWDSAVEDEEVLVEAEPVEEHAPTLDLGDGTEVAEALDRATGPHATEKELDPFDIVSQREESDEAVILVDEEADHAPRASATPLPFDVEDDESTVVDGRMLGRRTDEPASFAPPDDPFTAPEDDPFGPPDVSELPPPAVIPPPPVFVAPPPPAASATSAEPEAGADLFEEELAEAEFLVQQGLEDDARHALEAILSQAPHHARAQEMLAGLAPGEKSLPPTAPPPAPAPAPAPAAAASDGFNLADELSDEFDGMFDAIARKDEVREEGPGPGPDGQYSVEDVLSEFKKKLATQVSAEDSQTHYELGIAFREMGLFDEAIGEFETALAGKKRVIDCLTMLGLCRAEKGDLEEAVRCFDRALKPPGLTLEASKAAHFEMGAALERLGRPAEALDHFARVYKADPAFRDVKVRVQRLQSQVKGTNGAHTNGHANGTGARQAPAVGRASMPAPVRKPAAPAPASPEAPPAGGNRGKIGFV